MVYSIIPSYEKSKLTVRVYESTEVVGQIRDSGKNKEQRPPILHGDEEKRVGEFLSGYPICHFI